MNETNAIAMLKNDHSKVKELFDQFESADEQAETDGIIGNAIEELKIHATIEEEIFYPALRDAQIDEALMNEAEQEHHVARMLIAELDTHSGNEGRRHAKFKVLAEAVRHHIKEEEGKVFPDAKDLDIDFEELGSRMMERKAELMDRGVPPDAEHKMVAAAANGGKSRSSQGERTVVGKKTTAKERATKESR
jgi:Hemerythrin HHE cation binding domain